MLAMTTCSSANVKPTACNGPRVKASGSPELAGVRGIRLKRAIPRQYGLTEAQEDIVHAGRQ